MKKYKGNRASMTGEQYRAVRESMGLTQQELADILDVHVQTIYRRERGDISRESEMSLHFVWLSRSYDVPEIT